MIPLYKVIICIVLAVIPLGYSIALAIVGAIGRRRALRPVEYYPPRGFSPIDVMIEYYGKHCKPRELFNPIMLFWAENGYIKIEEDCRRGLKLTKLKELDAPDELPVNIKGKKGGKDKKNKKSRRKPLRIDEARLSTFKLEKQLWKELFGLSDVFYTLAASDTYADRYKDFAKDCSDEAKSTCVPSLLKLRISAIVPAMLVIVAVTVILGATLHDPAFLMMIFPIVGIAMRRAVPMNSLFVTIFFCAWGGIPLAVFAFAFGYDASVIAPLAVALVAAILVLYVFDPLIDIRTPQNLEYYGRLDAFKTFLLQAELDELETLIEENPDYYFDVLPYCYIFRITEKVKPKFDRIRMDGPGWFLADDEIGDYRDRLMF